MTRNEFEAYRKLQRERAGIINTAREIRSRLGDPQHHAFDGLPKTRETKEAIERLLEKQQRIQRGYLAKLDQIAERILAIEQAIDSLPPDERDVMRRRYILGHSVAKVATDTFRSERAVKKLTARAIANTQKCARKCP